MFEFSEVYREFIGGPLDGLKTDRCDPHYTIACPACPEQVYSNLNTGHFIHLYERNRYKGTMHVEEWERKRGS